MFASQARLQPPYSSRLTRASAKGQRPDYTRETVIELLLGGRDLECMAGTTGLEPATSAVTGQRSNQLSYVPSLFSWKELRHLESQS